MGLGIDLSSGLCHSGQQNEESIQVENPASSNNFSGVMCINGRERATAVERAQETCLTAFPLSF